MALRAAFLLVLAVAQLSRALANTAADTRRGAIPGRKLQQWHDRESHHYYSDRSERDGHDSQPMSQMGIGGLFVYTWYTNLGTVFTLCFAGVGLEPGCGCGSGTTCTIVQYSGAGVLGPISVAGTNTQLVSFPKSFSICADTAGTLCQSIAAKTNNLLQCTTAATGCSASDRSYDRNDYHRDEQRVHQSKYGVTPTVLTTDPYVNLLGVTTCGPAAVVNAPNCGCATGSACQFVGNHNGTDLFYCLTNVQCSLAAAYGGGYYAWLCQLASGCPASADRSYDNRDYERYDNRDYERYDNRDYERYDNRDYERYDNRDYERYDNRDVGRGR